MYHKSLTNLLKLSKKEIQHFINSFDTVLTDCDGVLWLENKALEGSPEVLNKLREMGKKVFYVTNNSLKISEEFVAKAHKLGFKCIEGEMISTSSLAAKYLKSKDVKKAYVMGATGITRELEKVGIASIGLGPNPITKSLGEHIDELKLDPDVHAVVVGFDEHISYLKIMIAASYLANPACHYVATNTDENFPVGSTLMVPGTGTMVAAVSTCAGRQPTVLGKPNPYIVEAIMQEHKIEPKRTLMIGDRCNTDILLGTKCGFQTLLVLSGVSTLDTSTALKNSGTKDGEDCTADVYLGRLGELLPFLEEI